MRVLRVYHAGRDPSHRQRERALVTAGIDLTLVVPRSWSTEGSQENLSSEPFPIVELDTERIGDVNRHCYRQAGALERVLRDVGPDIVDIHEEPFSVAGRQWLAVVPSAVPVVLYTAQNVDKRLPPPFDRYERAAHRRVAALYPCSRQAAAVARGKGFGGLIEVLPLGFDPEEFIPGSQSLDDELVTLLLLGRLVPEKGIRDAVRILAEANRVRPTRLLLVGSGPEKRPARALASSLGVGERLEVKPWGTVSDVAAVCRSAHVLLIPSTPTKTWTEQFGRVIVEAQASGAVVAGYATGSIPEVARDEAVLAPEGDWCALSNALRQLLSAPEEYKDRRRRGFELSSTRTWDRVGARQVRLYERVVRCLPPRLALPRSPQTRRALARAEFGPTAPTLAGRRPFALPVLRSGGVVSAGLAAVIDTTAELKARLPLQRSRSASA